MTGFLTDLSLEFADCLNLRSAILDQHSHGEDRIRGGKPHAVLFAENVLQIQNLLKICHAHCKPIIAFGAGTSLEGHVVAGKRGGVALNLSGMNQILAIYPENQTARIQAGVTRQQLNRELKNLGLFFSVDPGSEATIGGMAATGASGTNSVRYGTIRDNILSMQAVMANGALIETATHASKSSAGYNMTQLLIGSEGTLGIITELLVKLHPIPDYLCALTCQFENLQILIENVIALLHADLNLARIELIDAAQMKASIGYSDLKDFAILPTLFLEFAGKRTTVQGELTEARDILQAGSAQNINHADKVEARNALWQARHHAFYAALASAPAGSHLVVTDSCVPIDALAEVLEKSLQAIEASGLDAPIVGHVGDGNFHAQIVIPPNDETAAARAEKLSAEISNIAISHQGTCTGEHGIGLGKMKYLKKQHGDLLPFMRLIKQAFDPDNILNPDKMFEL